MKFHLNPWYLWLLWFAIEEGYGLAHRGQGLTLSENVWKWFSVKEKGKLWRLRRFALLSFLAWLLIHFLSGGAYAQEVLPFAVKNEHKLKFPAARAEKIYEYTLAQLARKIDFKNPPELHPRITLVLGSDSNRIDCRPNNDRDISCSTVELKSWDAASWADGVAVCAATQLLSRKEIDQAAHEAAELVGVTPDELKAGK